MMFSGRFPIDQDRDGCIFIDRSPKHFGLILDFLRGGVVNLPSDESALQEILREFTYYKLQDQIVNESGKEN
uniref:Potassium channel tetramerisation-type BTB domain-containing protein n=1 Tax=Arcella intermedia TaxID=1963864 RepID=A0A6B2LV56_9EUKA